MTSSFVKVICLRRFARFPLVFFSIVENVLTQMHVRVSCEKSIYDINTRAVLFNRDSAKNVGLVRFRVFQGYREGSSFFKGILGDFYFSMLMRHYEIFRSPCRIQSQSRPVCYVGG